MDQFAVSRSDTVTITSGLVFMSGLGFLHLQMIRKSPPASWVLLPAGFF